MTQSEQELIAKLSVIAADKQYPIEVIEVCRHAIETEKEMNNLLNIMDGMFQYVSKINCPSKERLHKCPYKDKISREICCDCWKEEYQFSRFNRYRNKVGISTLSNNNSLTQTEVNV